MPHSLPPLHQVRIKEKKLQLSEKEALKFHSREKELKKMLASLQEKATLRRFGCSGCLSVYGV